MADVGRGVGLRGLLFIGVQHTPHRTLNRTGPVTPIVLAGVALSRALAIATLDLAGPSLSTALSCAVCLHSWHGLELIHDFGFSLPTRRCRCHTSRRRSRFSGVGAQMRGKSSFSISFKICSASRRSLFCRTLLGSDLRRIAYPYFKFELAQQALEPARVSASLNSHAYLFLSTRDRTAQLQRDASAAVLRILRFPCPPNRSAACSGDNRILVSIINIVGFLYLNSWSFGYFQVYSALGGR
jgi:hypothetical protein